MEGWHPEGHPEGQGQGHCRHNRLVFYRQKWAEVVRREEEAEQKRQQRAQRRPLS